MDVTDSFSVTSSRPAMWRAGTWPGARQQDHGRLRSRPRGRHECRCRVDRQAGADQVGSLAYEPAPQDRCAGEQARAASERVMPPPQREQRQAAAARPTSTSGRAGPISLCQTAGAAVAASAERPSRGAARKCLTEGPGGETVPRAAARRSRISEARRSTRRAVRTARRPTSDRQRERRRPGDIGYRRSAEVRGRGDVGEPAGNDAEGKRRHQARGSEQPAEEHLAANRPARVGAQPECHAAKDDREQGDGERRQQGGAERREGGGKRREQDRDREDQPDVVGLPDRADRGGDRFPVCAAASGEQIQDAGAEVSPAKSAYAVSERPSRTASSAARLTRPPVRPSAGPRPVSRRSGGRSRA